MLNFLYRVIFRMIILLLLFVVYCIWLVSGSFDTCFPGVFFSIYSYIVKYGSFHFLSDSLFFRDIGFKLDFVIIWPFSRELIS